MFAMGVERETVMTLDNRLMPAPDGHPQVFERESPLQVADIDRYGRLRLDAAARHVQGIGPDQLRELGFEDVHPLWVARRTRMDVINPIEFRYMLRMRRWCSPPRPGGASSRCASTPREGGLIECEAIWININPNTLMPSRISDDFMEGLRRTTDVDRLRWHPYLRPGDRDTAIEIHDYPVRFTDIDLFNHMNNAAYWSVVEDYLSATLHC